MAAKHVVLLALAVAVGGALAASAQAPPATPATPAIGAQVSADGSVDLSFFYNNLSSYGHWVQHGTYGWVFLPFGLQSGWRPYSLGHWVETDYGWTWVSDEPFGWAAYHYGRWADDDQYGWIWVPGYDWGPAWVAWRNGGGYIGWAPLPPAVQYNASVGIDLGGVNLDVSLAPTQYCFVEEKSFLAANVATYVAPPARNVTIIHNTTNITKYSVVNHRVVNQGVAIDHIEQVTGKRVQRLQIAAAARTAKPSGPQVHGNQLVVYRPTVVKKATPPPPPPASARATGNPADLARQHQQETQNLQQSQVRERGRLQQIHQTEAAKPAAPAAPAQPAAPANNPRDKRQVATPEQRTAGGGQGAAKAGGSPAPAPAALAAQHDAEVKAQQQQHQREQTQLQARHQAEVQTAQHAQPQKAPAAQAKRPEPAPQSAQPKKEEPKRPGNPPPDVH